MNKNIFINQFSLEQITPEILKELKEIYSHSYYNTHMFEDLLEDIKNRPAIFRLFLARDKQTGDAVGARVIEEKKDKEIDYFHFPPVYGKRFSILPAWRSQGIGREIIKEGKDYCFNELDLKVIFGQSNEAGALSLYGKEDALYLKNSIENISHRNTPEQNIFFFKKIISDPDFKSYRFIKGNGIYFVYPRDETTKEFFQSHGYISYKRLLELENNFI